MEWQIKIGNQPRKRILVNFDPRNEIINFRGQYKVSNKDYVDGSRNSLWIDFSEESHQMAITLEDIQKIIVRVFDKMNERIVVHEDLTKSFGVIQNVELNKD